jgi:hypothetical protein
MARRPIQALQVLLAAVSGADVLVLCDTNGGSFRELKRLAGVQKP